MLTDPVGGVYKKLVLKDDKLIGGVPLRRHGRRLLVLQAAARRPQRRTRSATRLMFGESNIGDTGHQGQSERRCAMADDRRGLRLQRRLQGHDRARRSRRRACSRWTTCASTPRRRRPAARAPAWSSRSSMSTAGGDYSADAEDEAAVRLHRASAPGSARRDPRAAACCRSRRRWRFLEWRTPNGCATCRPALNYYLISHVAARRRRTIRSRASSTSARTPTSRRTAPTRSIPRMWGGETTLVRAAPHRRRRRQVRDPDGQGHRRPAHRPAGREEGRPGRQSGRTSACRRATPTPRRCAR